MCVFMFCVCVCVCVCARARVHRRNGAAMKYRSQAKNSSGLKFGKVLYFLTFIQ
jgi:hypothetical protein